jgi:hypothetical protein
MKSVPKRVPLKYVQKKITIQPLIGWTVLKFAVSKQEKRNQGLSLS